MSPPPLHCLFDKALWSRERDGVDLPAQGAQGAVTISVTRAGLAALVAKDRSEVSADAALSLLQAHSEVVGRAAQTSYDQEPRTVIIIDYADIERAL